MTAVLDAAAPASSPPSARIGREARVDRAIRHLAVGALWAGLLVVTYWWDAGGGIGDLGRWASGLTSLGRLTGLWSAQLLLAQVLLMSRLPPLEHAFGRDRLARTPRVAGFLSFDLILAPLVLIVYGYAAGRWTAVPATAWDLVVNYGGILLSVAGTA